MMDVAQNSQKSSGYEYYYYEKKMYVVIPRCAAAAAAAAAAVVPAVVGAPAKEYAHPYSMMHRRLTTAGIEVAPHDHQLLP